MELKIKAASVAMLAMILLACCAASGAAAQGDSSPSSRALKAVAGVNLVTSAGQLAGLDQEGINTAVFSYRHWQMPDGWDKTGRKLSAAQNSPCLGCANGEPCTAWPWVCCKRGGDGQTCCSMGSIFGGC